MYQPELSDLQFPSYPKLLERALKALHAQGLKPLAPIECVVVGAILQQEDPLRSEDSTGVGDWVAYQLDTYDLPKYVALVSWLSPFGLVSQHPKLIFRLAAYLLGDTATIEERNLPDKVRVMLGIQS